MKFYRFRLLETKRTFFFFFWKIILPRKRLLLIGLVRPEKRIGAALIFFLLSGWIVSLLRAILMQERVSLLYSEIIQRGAEKYPDQILRREN